MYNNNIIIALMKGRWKGMKVVDLFNSIFLWLFWTFLLNKRIGEKTDDYRFKHVGIYIKVKHGYSEVLRTNGITSLYPYNEFIIITIIHVFFH